MATDKTQHPEVVLETDPSTGSCIAQPDDSFWPYGDLMEHIDHSFAEVGQFSHETDFSQMGSHLDGRMTAEATAQTTAQITAQTTAQTTAQEITEANITLDFATLATRLDHAVRSQDMESYAALQRLHPRLSATIDFCPGPYNALVVREDANAAVAGANSHHTSTNTNSRITRVQATPHR